MQKILFIIGAALILILILGLILFRLFTPSTEEEVRIEDPFKDIVVTVMPTTSNGAQEAAESCYQWYVQKFAVNSDVISSAQGDAMLSTCFSNRLLNSWSQIIEETNADPVLYAQDFYPSWISSVRAQVVSELSQTASVIVTLGQGSEQHVLSVQLERVGGSWKIDAVSPR